MTQPSEDFDDPIRTVGHDATATFDNTASNPTEHASSEALGAATANEDEPDPVSASDDAIEPLTADGADEEAPIDGEYLSDPAMSNSAITGADELDGDSELEDDDDDDGDEEDDDEEDDLDDEEEEDDEDLKGDEDADLESDESPQTSIGSTNATKKV